MAWVALACAGTRSTCRRTPQLVCRANISCVSHALNPHSRTSVQRPLQRHNTGALYTFHSARTARSSQGASVPTELNKKTLSTAPSQTSTTPTASTTSTPPKPRKRIRKPIATPRATFTWSQEMDAKILEMRLEGNTWKEIGQATGRDATVCHQRYVKELDPALHQTWTPQRLEELNKMVASGKTWREISERFLVIPSQCREKWMSINPELVAQAKQKKNLNSRRIGGRGAPIGREFVQETGSVLTRPHRWGPHMDAVLIDLRERGLTWRQIGTVFGATPMTVYMRYVYKLKPKLDSGWVPTPQDTTNTAFYLLRDRPRPVVAPSSLTAAGGSESSDPTVSTPPRSWLSSVSDDYSYPTEFAQESRRLWTPEEDAALIMHRNEGSGFATIGREMSIDPDACYYRYYTALDPASQKKWTRYHSGRLCFLIKHGLSWSVIAYALGFHRLICQQKWVEISGAQSQASSTGPNKNSSQDHTSNKSVDGVSTQDKGSDPSGASQSARYNPLIDDRVQDEDYDGDGFEDEDDQDGEDVIDELGSGDKEENNAYEVDGDETDDGDLLNTDDGEDEGVVVDRLAMGRHSKKKNKLAKSYSPERTHSIWDQDAYLKEVQKTWTLDEENALIQHVIRNGTRNWHEISNHFGGAHSPEECRAYWKYLDMPVVRGTTKESIWEPQGEAQFWRLWLEHGSDFVKISSQLRMPLRLDTGEGHGLSALSKSTSARSTAEDCAELFKQRTDAMSKDSGTDESSKDFQQACVELALSRSTPPAFMWDKEKSVKLQKLVRQRLRTRGVQVNWINWKWVARHVGSGVTAQRCNLHWRWLRKTEMETHEWTEEDIQLLEQGVREIGPVFHHEISETNAGNDGVENMSTSSNSGPGLAGFKTIQRFYLPNRAVDKLQRKYFLLSDKATQVTVEEYMAIMDAVEEHGQDWDKVAESLRALSDDTSGRRGLLPSGFNSTAWTKAPCRRVWEASYQHTLQHTPWTEREDQDLKEAVHQIGKNNWLIIARFFPGKSPWQCRLRWCSITDPIS